MNNEWRLFQLIPGMKEEVLAHQKEKGQMGYREREKRELTPSEYLVLDKNCAKMFTYFKKILKTIL